MRLAVSGETTEATLAFGRQIGATEFLGGPGLPTEPGYFRYQDFLLLRSRVQDAGLWYEVTGMPEEWTYKITPGLPDRDRQTDSRRCSIENLESAGFRSIIDFFTLRSSIGHHGLRIHLSWPGQARQSRMLSAFAPRRRYSRFSRMPTRVRPALASVGRRNSGRCRRCETFPRSC